MLGMRARMPKNFVLEERLERYSSAIEMHPTSYPGRWIEVCTPLGASAPAFREVRLDLGCGKGSFAAEAARRSHQLILTSDNPRNERPADILDDMLAGLDDEQKQAALVIEDRAQAIRTACRLAGKGDVVLVAGKGHENYQEIEGVKHHFDDSEQVRLNLKL